MSIDAPTPERSPISAGNAFVRGFLIRLLHGTVGILIVLLLRPDLLGEKRHILLGSIVFYLLVCIAGGAYDAATRKTRRVRLFQNQKPRVVSFWLLAVVLIVLLISLYLGR